MLPERVYSAESPLKYPKKFAKKILADFHAAGRLGFVLFLRDLKSRYRQPLLGYLWIVIMPISTTLAFMLLHRANLWDVGSLGMPFSIFVMTGTFLWQSFVEGVNGPLRVFKSQRKILEKSESPPEIIFISLISELLFNYVFRFSVLVLALLIFTKVHPFYLIGGFIFGFGLPLIGMVLGISVLALNGLFKDFEQGILVFTSFLFYVTPVAYAEGKIPGLQRFHEFNPLAVLINNARSILVLGDSQYLATSLLWLLGLSIFCLLAWVFFRISLPYILERIM